MKKLIIIIIGALLFASPMHAYPYNESHNFKDQLQIARSKTVKIYTAYNSRFEGYRSFTSGSGAMIGNGFILTNDHVIGENTGTLEVTVTTYDGVSHDAKLINSNKELDLALLHIESDAGGFLLSNIEPFAGMPIMSVGNPVGLPDWSFSEGFIINAYQICNSSIGIVHNIMSDNEVLGGNSGGPLINDTGKLIGIVRAKSPGMSYSIPMNDIQIFLNSNDIATAF